VAPGNRKAMFDLLFHAARASLKCVITTEQGFDPAAAMVLHTWNQKLDAHAQAVVPGRIAEAQLLSHTGFSFSRPAGQFSWRRKVRIRSPLAGHGRAHFGAQNLS
jgi:hypothetical protein